ncbi:hypothetical protein [Comamonas sp.]|uniref:hypothetical protein n=1 Tax=Comamonas sp. TaxID=34028 RepID=UPI002583B058|nr:hypothetical protein [Comamonas sp.]
MFNSDARQPPRFVPTLTDVVQEQAAPAPTPDRLSTVTPEPPLEENFAEPVAEQVEVAAVSLPMSPPIQAPVAAQDWSLMAQAMQVSVMARLDSALQERLRYALSDLVQMHTQSLYQAIRQDVEQLVSVSVHEAIAQELAHLQKTQED